jgi:hypothetical protein
MRAPSSTRSIFLVAAIALAAAVTAATAPPLPGRERPPAPAPQPASPSTDPTSRGQPPDVAPLDSHLSAYRLDRLIVVAARGSNRTGGFTTRLESGRPDADPPEVHLRNIPPPRGTAATQAITPFDLAAYFTPAAPEVTQITIITAGRPITVEVKPIEEMKRSQQFSENGSPAPQR